MNVVELTGVRRNRGMSLMPESEALETIKSRIKERLHAKGLSNNEASRRAGLGLSFVADILAGRSKSPSRPNLSKLARVLDCDVDYLYGELDAPNPEPTRRTPVSSSIPLYGVGLADPEGYFKLDDATAAPIEVSPPLAPGAFAVTVPDDSNAPRYLAGEIVITNPARPVARGAFAVLALTDGRAAIREIESVAPDKVMVRTLAGGDRPVAIPRSEIQTIQRIVCAREP